jgi:cell division protein FtsB
VEKKQPGNKKFSKRIIISAAVLIAGLLLFLGIGSGVSLYGPYRKVKHLEADLKQATATIDSLNRQIQSLKTDTAYIERIARERLGMARKDEKIYKFLEEK